MTKYFKWQGIIFNLCIMLNCLLIFLLFFGDQLKVPVFLQVLGRAHPLVLHFPIVLLLLAFVFEVMATSSKQALLKEMANWVLLAACFTTVIAALMGLFLSKESGYDGNEVAVHKWLGAICALLSFLWYAARNAIRKSKLAVTSVGVCASLFLLAAGHYGANLTHGNDFLLLPIKASEATPRVSLADAVIYQHLVKPILQQKCISCHNSSKAKGGLIMENEQSLLKGGKNGKLWNLAEADFGRMMQRIHLPEEHKDHMPPKGKLQLTDQEIKVLYLWIKGGASFTQKVIALSPSDSLRTIAASFFSNDNNEDQHLPALDRSKVAQLNTDYRSVVPVDVGSNAVAVSFYGVAQYNSKQLAELDIIKNNIVSLQLSKMPLGDEELKVIGNFVNLRRLNLAFTNVKGSGLKYLSDLHNLNELSLSGTGINISMLNALKKLKKLKTVQLWNTPISEKEMGSLKGGFPGIKFDMGFNGDTVKAKLNAPIIDGGKKTFKGELSVKIKSSIRSAVIRYTLDCTEPDSIKSPIYKAPLVIGKSTVIKAKSYLKGWISSNTTQENFYRSNLSPDSIKLLTLPDKKFAIKTSNALFDGELGPLSFSAGTSWTAYRETPLEALLFFKQPVMVGSVAFRSLIDIGSFIMPPLEIEVWGGSNTGSLSLLKKLKPVQPTKESMPYIENYSCSFQQKKVTVIKLIVKPLRSLPAWHPGKGEKGWVFIDEVFLN